MGLTRAGYCVTAMDLRCEAIAYALEHGLIARGATDEAGLADLLKTADAIVLGLYPAACVAWVCTHAAFLHAGVTVTDVSGVKSGIVDEIQACLAREAPGVEFIASHPMAGREVSGVEHADCAMFALANFLIVPTEKNTPAGVTFARELAETLGFSRITTLSCTEHDRIIGYVSQLTHVIALCLMNATDNTHLAAYTGDSFRDLTRIARMNEQMWSELFLLNRDNLTAEIDAFSAALSDVRAKLAAGDTEGLQALMRQSTERRAAFG